MLPTVRTNRAYNPSVFDYFFSNNALDNFWSNESSSYSPSVNISENDKAFNIELAAPGVDKKDFSINVDDKTLTIAYEHKQEEEQKNEDLKYLRREFVERSFTKNYTLPENVNSDKISAEYTNGVLNVSIPKVKENKISKLINIS